MDITQVDLLGLKKTLDMHLPLLEADIKILNRLFWFFPSEKQPECDIIMVLGNPACVEERLPAALDIWRQFPDSYLLLCGGAFIPDNSISEAESMREACLDSGINKSKIVLENESTTTRENIQFSATIVNNLNITCPVIDVISSLTHLRRIMMNFNRFLELYPEGTSVVAIPSIPFGITMNNWLQNEHLLREVSMELGFIHEYLYELGYSPFDI